jgi:starch synthase (maltosyl-transferring)
MAVVQKNGQSRVVIEGISPEVDGGRFPAKRCVGDLVSVEADVFTDGHDTIAAALLFRHESAAAWTMTPMRSGDNDRWVGEFAAKELGRYHFKVQGWIDHPETWRRDLVKRIAADSDVELDYLIGADMVTAAAGRAKGPDAAWLKKEAAFLRTQKDAATRREHGTAAESDREWVITVDPVRARFSAWYELFPRSTSDVAGKHGTFADCEKRLPGIAEMGFDVVYLPPIHPIGTQYRKGKNNSTVAEPGDVGSPWAIGAVEGGHKDILPALGTIVDFRRFVTAAKGLGLEVALDIAFQVSPDHPYVKSHEEWFKKRPDGTIQYAENPPKTDQEIYPFDFETTGWVSLWEELKSVFTYWIAQGVTIFRVDNPHTKAFPFWEWAITEIKRECPEAMFLAEAFTRPKVMYRLAKLGYTQSYTYFPWRNEKKEITEYIEELTQTGVREFFRPNHWPNTPDILTGFLQLGGTAVFQLRLLLVATLGANYGIYGPAFELMDSAPMKQGGEEYLDSEKYQIRDWDLDRSDSLRPLITQVNTIRQENAALQNDWTTLFHETDNEQLICYSKRSVDRTNLLVMVVNLDPRNMQSGFVTLDLAKLSMAADAAYEVEDLLTGERYQWHGARNYVALHPETLPGHVLRVSLAK